MKRTGKILITIAAFMLPTATMPCVFTITNDSSYGTVYVVTDENIATSVHGDTLRQMAKAQKEQKGGEADVVEIKNAGHNNTAKTKKNMWFFVYTPNADKATFDRTYKVEIKYCDMTPGANEPTIADIEKGCLKADYKKNRYVVTNLKKSTEKICNPEGQAVSRPVSNNEIPAKCTNCEPSPMKPVAEGEMPKEITREHLGKFWSNEQVFPDTLP